MESTKNGSEKEESNICKCDLKAIYPSLNGEQNITVKLFQTT